MIDNGSMRTRPEKNILFSIRTKIHKELKSNKLDFKMNLTLMKRSLKRFFEEKKTEILSQVLPAFES